MPASATSPPPAASHARDPGDQPWHAARRDRGAARPQDSGNDHGLRPDRRQDLRRRVLRRHREGRSALRPTPRATRRRRWRRDAQAPPNAPRAEAGTCTPASAAGDQRAFRAAWSSSQCVTNDAAWPWFTARLGPNVRPPDRPSAIPAAFNRSIGPAWGCPRCARTTVRTPRGRTGRAASKRGRTASSPVPGHRRGDATPGRSAAASIASASGYEPRWRDTAPAGPPPALQPRRSVPVEVTLRVIRSCEWPSAPGSPDRFDPGILDLRPPAGGCR
jgi:hypothetical protein